MREWQFVRPWLRALETRGGYRRVSWRRGPTLVGGGVVVEDDDELGALDGVQGGVVHPPAEVPLPHERPLRPPLRRPRGAGGGMEPMGMGHGGEETDPAPSPPRPSLAEHTEDTQRGDVPCGPRA